MPRRWYTYPPEWQSWNVLSSAGASILAIAYALPLFYLGWAQGRGQSMGRDGLEWTVPSPPPQENFEDTPEVALGPYAYDPERDTFMTQEGTAHVR
jgi:cytochrome c oxidase subunit I